MLKYSAQHNGKGKYHLIGDGNIYCGSQGMLNFTKVEEVIYENGKFYEFYFNNKQSIAEWEYCEKCLKKVRKQNIIK